MAKKRPDWAGEAKHIKFEEGVPIRLLFLTNDPVIQQGMYGETYIFKVMTVDGREKDLYADSQRLRGKLGDHYPLKDKWLDITRTGSGFQTNYEVEYVGSKEVKEETVEEEEKSEEKKPKKSKKVKEKKEEEEEFEFEMFDEADLVVFAKKRDLDVKEVLEIAKKIEKEVGNKVKLKSDSAMIILCNELNIEPEIL